MAYSKYIASVSFSPYVASTIRQTNAQSFYEGGNYSYYETYSDALNTYSISYTVTYGETTASFLSHFEASNNTQTISAYGTLFTNSDFWSAYAIVSYSDSTTNYLSTLDPYFEFGAPDFVEIYAATTITTDIGLRVTTTQQQTYYGPIEGSSRTYSQSTTTVASVSGLTNKILSLVSYFIVGAGNRSYTEHYDYFERGGGQDLLALYTTTALNGEISSYATIIHRTESLSATRSAESILYGAGNATYSAPESYTLTFDNITTTSVPSTRTTLQRLTGSIIDFFSYGYIRSSTQTFNVTTANTQSSTQSFIFQASEANTGASGYASKLSFTHLAHKATTSLITSYREISGLSKADSFQVRVRVSALTTKTVINGFATISNQTLAPAPLTLNTYLGSTFDRVSNVGTFYTEKATFASFATPNYTQAYKNYDPEGLSFFLLALIPLNYSAEQGNYPSFISLYDGNFTSSRDRAETTLLSVTVNQSSSSSGLNTSAYQTVSYNIGNNTASSTTKTTSIVFSLVSQASSSMRLVRTSAENITSLFTLSYLPTMPLDGSNVVYTRGLHGDASYNIDKLMINAYSTNQSTFADSSTLTFPASVSYITNFSGSVANKITISKFYEFRGGGQDYVTVGLQQFYQPPQD